MFNFSDDSMETMIYLALVLASLCAACRGLGLGVPQPNGSPQLPPAPLMGDVKLTMAQRKALDQGADVSHYAVSNKAFHRWPDAIIPYEFDCSLEFMASALSSVKEAIAEWEAKTCLRFVPRTTEKDYLHFFRDTHCWGNVGRIGGASRISIGDGCDYKHVMEHEIGHVVGFFHEQNRMDRDNYVDVKWENIDEWVKSAFEKIKDTESLGVAYDYASIMHYPWHAFSKNGKDTMAPKRPVQIQPYLTVSKLDAKQTSLMYDCPAVMAKRRGNAARFQPAPTTKVCVNKAAGCASWARMGYCLTDGYTSKNCPLSCQHPGCDLAASCVDTKKDCALWASWKHCDLNPTVYSWCPGSCIDVCKQTPTQVPPPPGTTSAPTPPQRTVPVKPSTRPAATTAGPTLPPVTGTLPTTNSGSIRLGTGILCLDTHPQCASWASTGECSANPGWMLRECKLSCNATDCDRGIQRPPGTCAEPLGLAYDGNGYKIPDANLKAASHLSPGSIWNAAARNARLYFVDDHVNKRIGAWCVKTWDDFKAGAYIEIDLGQQRTVRYIATQGRHMYFERVSKFKISHSTDGVNFNEYQENGATKIFDANCDHFTPILNEFNSPITARHLRLQPTEANYPCIRMEFYGC